MCTEARTRSPEEQSTAEHGDHPVRVAFSRPVVVRALVLAAIVGPILIAINHGDAIIEGQVTGRRLCQIGLTFLVPYLVSTVSSVLAAKGTP